MRRLAHSLFAAALLLVVFAAYQFGQPSPAPAPVPQSQTAAAETAASAPIATSSLVAPDTYPVVRVVDGDTLKIFKDGATTTIRVIGLDTPEVVDPKKPVQCYGPEASVEAHQLLDGQNVRIETDPTQDLHDKYGRLLAYVFLPDGTLFEQFMIAQGFGREYTYKVPYEYQAQFRAVQTQAQVAGKGLWSTCAGGH